MAELNFDNILTDTEIDSLFSDESTETSEEKEDKKSEEIEKTEEKETTEEVNVEDLFNVNSESVGSEEENIEEKEDTASKKGGTSPKNNFYSSIAKALKEDGVFPDLDDEDANKVTTAEDFADVFERVIQDRLDEKQKRIDKALNAGIESSIIREYENSIKFLDSIDDDAIKQEGQDAENLRKRLIYQDFINRGYSKDEAVEEVQDIFDNGTDIKKATRALESNRKFFKENYQKMIDEAEEEAKAEENERKQQAESLRKSILEDNKAFGELNLDKATRQKIFNNISKPIYKDKDTGELFTAIQKYERENKTEFLKNVGLLYTLTDGFKSLDNLVKGKVKKEMKKGLRELENTINNTSRTSDGNLKFTSGVEDSNSYIGVDFDIDV